MSDVIYLAQNNTAPNLAASVIYVSASAAPRLAQTSGPTDVQVATDTLTITISS